MKIYINPRAVSLKHFLPTLKRLTKVQFITEETESYDCEVMVTMPHMLDYNELDKYSNLKWILLTTAGYDTVDLAELKARQIMLTHAKGAFSIQIAEDVIAKILYFNRHLKRHMEQQSNQLWKPIYTDHEIYESTVGIIGAGSIGQHIAERLKAFDTHILGYKRTPEQLPHFDAVYYDDKGLETLLKTSDIIVLSVPLSEKTYHLINDKTLQMMKPNALLINIARGEVIDQDALVKALKKGTIRGAALDVTTPEPLPKDHPLWRLENCFITPHDSSASPHHYERVLQYVQENIQRYLNNEPLLNQLL